jgi:ribosomal-protein-alanine N-acetyltransferase
MGHASTLALPNLTVRRLLQGDLPDLVQIEQPPPAPQWTKQDFRKIFQTGDTAGWVAVMSNRVVGYLIYQVTGQTPVEEGLIDCLRSRGRWAPGGEAREPFTLTLMSLAVAPAWRRQGVGRALLEKVNQKLQQAGDCIEVTVPESNLPLQFLLRGAAYKAVSVRRGYFGSEDGYLMERRGG